MEVKKIKEKIGKSLYSDLKKQKLTPKQIKFIAIYLTNGHNGVRAVKEAGYNFKNYNVCGVEANKLLKKPKINAAIKGVFDKWLDEKKTKLNKEIVDVLYKRAFYDITIFQTSLGKWKKLEDIPKEWRCCIDGVEEKYYGKDAAQRSVILKMANKDIALDKLDKFTGLTRDEDDGKIGLTKDTEELLKNIFESRRKNKNDK